MTWDEMFEELDRMARTPSQPSRYDLEAENWRLRALVMAMGDRILACSDVLSKLAERKELRSK